MSIFAFCAFLPREFERNRTLSKKTIYRLRKSLGWCIIKLKIRLRIFLYTPVLCLWSSDDRNRDQEFHQRETPAFAEHEMRNELKILSGLSGCSHHETPYGRVLRRIPRISQSAEVAEIVRF